MTLQLNEYLNKGNTVQELDEKSILELIDSGKAVVLKVWLSGCSFCAQYAPVFSKAASDNKDPDLVFAAFNLPMNPGESVFAAKFMTVDGKIKGSAPATMLFFEGQLKAKHYGAINEQQLATFMSTGEAPANKKQDAQRELDTLFRQKGLIITMAEKLDSINKRIAEVELVISQG
jgi:thiol-disulfide isomerase/thioredoxin